MDGILCDFELENNGSRGTGTVKFEKKLHHCRIHKKIDFQRQTLHDLFPFPCGTFGMI